MNHSPRSLDTLIQEFNRASELDRVSLLVTGKVHWFEVDGVRTRLVDSWLTELSPEERRLFEAYIAQEVKPD